MIYEYEGGFEGFLTAVFIIFESKDHDAELKAWQEDGETALTPSMRIPPDRQEAGRVNKGLSKLAKSLPHTLYRAWLTGLPGMDNTLLCVIRTGFRQGRDPRPMRYENCVHKVMAADRRLGSEVARYLQFTRFIRHDSGIYAADIEPEYDILHLIANHFCQRFNAQPFMIRDKKHGKTLLWDTRRRVISEDKALLMASLPDSGGFERLWRAYFKAVAIPARRNLRLQQHFVPKKYRRYLTEFDKTTEYGQKYNDSFIIKAIDKP